MKITVVGSGYVGLVTAACFASTGNDVVCLDVDARKIETLNSGGVPFYEPGLQALIAQNVAAGRLHFTTDVAHASLHGLMQFIAVGTPAGQDGSADLHYVLAAARAIGRSMTDYTVVVDKSTVPVGTADKVRSAIATELAARGIDVPFEVVSNPEFLKEGAALQDFLRPDRVVIGAQDERAIQLMRTLYAPFLRNHDRLVLMDVRSAELTKYAANAMLATRISFMNELANLAEKVGADIESVRLGIGSDSRIGYSFLYAGAGYGGSCFPKDIQALARTASDAGQPMAMLQAVEDTNRSQKQLLGRKIVERLGSDLTGCVFAVWGLAFKPNTDDMREAPSIVLIDMLLGAGAQVRAHDPVAVDECRRVLGERSGLVYVHTPLEACAGADALVVVTEWREYRTPDFDGIKALLKSPLVFDGRNLFEPTLMSGHGFEYHSVGRLAVRAQSQN